MKVHEFARWAIADVIVDVIAEEHGEADGLWCRSLMCLLKLPKLVMRDG